MRFQTFKREDWVRVCSDRWETVAYRSTDYEADNQRPMWRAYALFSEHRWWWYVENRDGWSAEGSAFWLDEAMRAVDAATHDG